VGRLFIAMLTRDKARNTPDKGMKAEITEQPSDVRAERCAIKIRLQYFTFCACFIYHTGVTSLQIKDRQCTVHTECPSRYPTRHFFNNSKTNEDIAKKFEQQYVIFFHISYTMR
jgi:hypothetical protein